MCSTDSKGRVVKEAFFPITPTNFRGGFEVLIKQGDISSNWRLSDSYDSFVALLDSLEAGDEVAFKGGSHRLNYLGKDDPIKYVTVISSGMGMAPALQILNGILTDNDSAVEDLELLWANSDKRDFVCDSDVESLESKFSEKLFVTRVHEPNLLSVDANFSEMDNILGALSAYEPNRIAIICGPNDLISKFRAFLLDVGYPQESILIIAAE